RDRLDLGQLLPLPALLQVELELHRRVEVVLDGALAAAGHEVDAVEPGGYRLLDDVLDHGLVDERQHLLGLGLRGGQEAGRETRGGEHGGADPHATDSFRASPALPLPADGVTRTSIATRGARMPWAAKASLARRRASNSSGAFSAATTRAYRRRT